MRYWHYNQLLFDIFFHFIIRGTGEVYPIQVYDDSKHLNFEGFIRWLHSKLGLSEDYFSSWIYKKNGTGTKYKLFDEGSYVRIIQALKAFEEIIFEALKEEVINKIGLILFPSLSRNPEL